MRIRRTILLGIPIMLYLLSLAFITMWVLEVKASTAFTDHAAPFLGQCLFFALPGGAFVMWLLGRTGEFGRHDKLIAWLSILPVLIPWGFVCFIALILLGWRGD